MIISPIFLSRMLDGYPVGDTWPYRGGKAADILAHIEGTIQDLRRLPNLIVSASLEALLDEAVTSAHVYCRKKQNGGVDQECEGPGVVVLISSLAPIAFYCPLTDYGAFNLSQAGHLPGGDWQADSAAIVAVLSSHGFEVPSREELTKHLPETPEIPLQFRGVTQAEIFF